MADSGAKRKKDVDHPRITYTTEDRTFDRLFKEESLDEVKAIVRKKLGLSAAVSVDLTQLREGRQVDLEDDDDFDAFYAFAHDRKAAEIRVSLKDGAEQSRADTTSTQVDEPPKKKRKKDRNPDVPDSQRSQSPSRSDPEPPTSKKKVSFDEVALKSVEKEKTAAPTTTPSGDKQVASAEPPVERKKERKRKKDKRLAAEASSTETSTKALPGSPQTPTQPAPQALSTPTPSSEAIEPKKAKKKRKASALDTAPAAQPEPSASKTIADEPPPPAKKSKFKHATETAPDSTGGGSVKQKKEKKTTEAGQPLPGKSTKAKDAPTSSSVSEPKKTVDGWTSTSNSTVDAEASDSPSVPIKKKKSSVAPPPAQTAPPKPASSAGKILEKQASKPTSKVLPARKTTSDDTSDSSEEDEEDDSVLLNPELQAFIKAEAAALIAGMIPSSKTAKLPSATPSTTAKPPTATSTGAQVPSQVNGTPSPSTTPPANCIICGATPHHLRNRCPVVKGGIKSMRSRISELESTEPDDKQPAALITEAVSDLKAMIQKKQDQNKKMNGKEKEVRPRTKSEGKETTNKKQTEDPADGDRESDGEEVQTPRVSQVAGVDVAYVGAARAELSSETEEPEEGLVSTKVASGSKETSGKISKSATTITSTPKVKESFDKVTTSTVTSKHQRHSSLQSPAALTLDTSTPNPFSPFLDFGDLSQYNDKDLEDIIRGPRLSVADVPSEDEDLDEEVPGQLLDDDDDDLRARKRNKLNYAGSSEEEDEEEDVEEPDQDKESDDEDARNLKAKDLAEEAHSSDSEKSDDDTGDASKEASKHRDGADQDNLSFGEIDAREGNSPIEVDLLGALGALEGDVSIVSTVRARSLSSQPSSAPLPPASQRAGDSDTLVGKNDKTSSPEPTSEDEPPAGSPKPAKTPSTQETPTQRRLDKETVSDLDPIEPVHEEIASPADPIHSDDETTQITVAAPRTRSQRNKFTSQLEKAAPAETNPQSQVDDQKTPRKRRSLSRLSELPVPPHPKSTRKGKAPSSVQPEPAEPQEEADEEQPPGTRKSARNKKPAPAKPLSKVSARRAAVPEEDPSADRAKDAGPSVEDQEEEDAVPVTRGKGANKPTKAQTKVPPRTPTKPPARSTRSRKGTSSSQAAGTEPVEQSLATWVSLPSEGHTQEDTEGGAMVDELASEAAHSESRDPLSMVSQTRESLPYSQYPGTDSRRRAQSVNSDDSDDANEVQETVTRSQPNPPRPSFTFRGLSQIISDVTFGSYVRPRTLGEAEPEDLYGRPKDGESEESGSDSDSEDEKKSHIPKERRAGLKA